MQQHVLSFVDEAGLVSEVEQHELSLGILTIYKEHLALHQTLRNVFLGAVSYLDAHEECFEFKFNYITKRSFPYYCKIIDIMDQHRDYWSYNWISKERGNLDFWDHYLDLFECLFTQTQYNHIVLADHLNKPRKSRRNLHDLEKEAVSKIIQIESQGSILLQVADIFLGAIMFKYRGGKDIYKQKIADKVAKTLLKNRSR